MENKQLTSKLKNNAIQPTAMRLLVLKYLMQQTSAVSLKNIEDTLDTADKSTIFRTLKTFEKNKLIHSIVDGSGITKFALQLEENMIEAKDSHYHFHCKKCQETFCLSTTNIPTIDLPKNFIMQEANIIVKGICANCN
jgi:Fur family ferric uptake transcriptional regulator